jgi:hypothetical protein
MDSMEKFWIKITTCSLEDRLIHARRILANIIKVDDFGNGHIRKNGNMVEVDFVSDDPCQDCTKVIMVLKSFFSTDEIKSMSRIDGYVCRFTV